MAELLLSCICSAGQTIIRRFEATGECADEGKELAARVHSTLRLLQKAVPAFENDASLRKDLVKLKIMFEDIDGLLSLCLPRPRASSTLGKAVSHAKRVYFSEQQLKALKRYSNQLDRLRLDLGGVMQLVMKQQQNRMEQQNNQVADALLAVQIILQDTKDPSMTLYKRQLQGNLIESELVELEESLGSGSFGKVMAGKYYGKPVAIKRALKEVLNAEDRESFRREASTHFALRHDRIVQVIAFRTGGGPHPPCLVMERMDRTLFDFLGIKSARLDLSGSLAYIVDICEGVEYLHQSGVLHRDIKSSNILLHDDGAKVSDFGLAHVCSTIGRSTGNGGALDEKAGTKFWMPPEAHCYSLGAYAYDSDIFSLGVVMWEIVEHRQGGRKHEPEIGRLLVSDPNAKLPLTGEGASDYCTSRLHRLIRACGSRDRHCRPKIGDLLAEAKAIYDSLSGPGDGTGPGRFRPDSDSSLRQSRGIGGESLRLSDVRRRAQKSKACESKRGSWEAWRDADIGVAVYATAGHARSSGVRAMPSPPRARASTTTNRASGDVMSIPLGEFFGVDAGRSPKNKSVDHQFAVGTTGGGAVADETKVASQERGGLGNHVKSRLSELPAKNHPDPARIKQHPTSFWIKLCASLNVIAGAAYIWWRAARSFPEHPLSPVWNWLFFAGECVLTVGIWASHLQRSFPAIMEVCTMDNLVEIDSTVGSEATVCIMVPTAGETMETLKDVLLGAFSQRLWPSPVPASRQLRIAVLDEKGRTEVRILVEKVYQLAAVLVTPAVQLELCTRFDEPFVTPKIFMDHFNQTAGLDKTVFATESHPAFDLATSMESSPGGTPGRRMFEGFMKLLNWSPHIASAIYFFRPNPGTPVVSPWAGNLNAAIFANSWSEPAVIGNESRIVVVNNARHRLENEFLQRTVPYFFKLNRRSGEEYEWADIGFVQTPKRFVDLHDGDPLGNRAACTFFIADVSKDGVGGVISHGQGSLWRVDALRGMAADGRQAVRSVVLDETVGHCRGFRYGTTIEGTHTSLDFFKLQWRSAFVCEAGEILSVCVHQPDKLYWKMAQESSRSIGAAQLVFREGMGFLCTSKMPTLLHKLFGLQPLTCLIQAVGGLFLILMPFMLSIFQHAPFDTVGLEFVYFFLPYIITAAVPTILALGWKNLKATWLLTDVRVWLSTCYIQIWGFARVIYLRIICDTSAYSFRRRCPHWPLGLFFCLLITSAINTTIYWAVYLEFNGDHIWIFLVSFGTSVIAMYCTWPRVRLWWRSAAFRTICVLIIISIAVTSVLSRHMLVFI